MNFTHTNFLLSPASPTSFIPQLPDEIHKVPSGIRRSVKLGKHRKFSRLPNPQQDTMLYSQPLQPTAHHVQATSTTPSFRLELSLKNRYNQDELTNNNNSKQTPPRKKLIPIRRSLYHPDPALSRHKQDLLKISFLSIEKLKLTNMLSDIEEKRQTPHTSHLCSLALQRRCSLQLPKNHSPIQLNYSPRKKIPPKQFIAPFDRYNYRDYLWRVCFSFRLMHTVPSDYVPKLKIYVGSGNNSMLIKSLFKLRNSWWIFTDKIQDANLVWTQIKVPDYFRLQNSQQKPKTQDTIDCFPLNKKFAIHLKEASNLSPQNKNQYLINNSAQKNQALVGKIELNDSNSPAKSNVQLVEANKLTQNSENKQDKLMERIFVQSQMDIWQKYFSVHRRFELKLEQSMSARNRIFRNKYTQIRLRKVDMPLRIHNHLGNNYIIGNKKALFYSMKKYYQGLGQDPFLYLPLTFHIKNGLQDSVYLDFLKVFYERAKRQKTVQTINEGNISSREGVKSSQNKGKNLWIVKPGEFTNRGNGIIVCLTLDQIKTILKRKQKHQNGNQKTYIIQSYIDRPFLYYRRKFDIRHYMMIASINGVVKGYWYQQGYIRTTSYEYTIKNAQSAVHLTNDAVQKYLPEYGKYQKGNKISYVEFQRYLDKQYKQSGYNFFETVLPHMKKIATDVIRASALFIDPDRNAPNFQIFGLDFMIDDSFKPWLIEVNTNPCLELSCPLLSDIIPKMVENALRICIDPLAPPPVSMTQKRPRFNDNPFQTNLFQLVYDSLSQQTNLIEKSGLDRNSIISVEADDQQLYEDQGNQIDM